MTTSSSTQHFFTFFIIFSTHSHSDSLAVVILLSIIKKVLIHPKNIFDFFSSSIFVFCAAGSADEIKYVDDIIQNERKSWSVLYRYEELSSQLEEKFGEKNGKKMLDCKTWNIN